MSSKFFNYFENAMLSLCLLNLSLGLTNGTAVLGLIFVVIAFVFSFRSLQLGLSFAFALLPLLAGLQMQVGHWVPFFQTTAPTFHYIDLMSGLLVGHKFRTYRSNDLDKKEISIFVFGLMFYLVMTFLSSTLGVIRNFSSSGSYFSVRGFLFNILHFKTITFLDDYKPLHDFLNLSFATLFSVFIFRLNLSVNDFKRIVLRPFLISSGFVALYGIFQKFWNIGFSRDGIGRGVNSFFPDLHSFAGFLMLPIVSLVWLFHLNSKEKNYQLAERFVLLILCLFCLLLTGSKATIVLFFLSVIFVFLLTFSRSNILSFSLKYKVSVFLMICFALGWIHRFGIGGIQVENFLTDFRDLNYEKFNLLMSYRPEIWVASLKMFEDFPVFGLGQGLFFRYSALFEFSGSKFLSSVNGENAHNYFIQRLVENGAFGFCLFASLFSLVLLNRNREFKCLGIYLVGAVLIGNLYAHAMLIPEIFFLVFSFLACAAPRISLQETLMSLNLRRRGSVFFWAIFCCGSLIFIGMGVYEIAARIKAWPFSWGSGCFKSTESALNRSSGQLGFEVPTNSKSVELEIAADHEDLGRRPVEISIFQLSDGKRDMVFNSKISHHGAQHFEVPVASSLVLSGAKLQFLVVASHCFVPKNFGLTTNTGTAGIRILRAVGKE